MSARDPTRQSIQNTHRNRFMSSPPLFQHSFDDTVDRRLEEERYVRPVKNEHGPSRVLVF